MRLNLVLEDGTVFRGRSFGAEKEVFGEVVFNTSMTGYQEIISDPSYRGQIILMTTPQIGNYGVCAADFESRALFCSGLIVREYSSIYSNWRATGSLADLLVERGIVGMEGIDTRSLTRHIRTQGAMRGVISSSDDIAALTEAVKNSPGLPGRDLVSEVTIDKAYTYQPGGKYRVAVLDFGIKTNILRMLADAGCELTVYPASTPAQVIKESAPDGIFLSNGPGDPTAVTYAIECVRKLLGFRPLFGICLGHQILSLALGATTYKLKFGHRGGNQPVKNLANGRVEITSQNHGFAVQADSLPKGVTVTHINLNDQTVEGISIPAQRAASVQYHPESSPGPHDSQYLFSEFIAAMEQGNDV